MKTLNLIAAMMIAVGLAVAPSAQGADKAKETIVQMKTLPHAVQKTLKSKAGTDKIVRVMRESTGGKDIYEAIVNRDGKEVAIQVDDTGHYVSTHDETADKGKVQKANKAEGH
jgi:hypothetical protein